MVQSQVEEARERLSSSMRAQSELQDQLNEARNHQGQASLVREETQQPYVMSFIHSGTAWGGGISIIPRAATHRGSSINCAVLSRERSLFIVPKVPCNTPGYTSI